MEVSPVARRGSSYEEVPPVRPGELPDHLLALAAEGISHVQLVIDPIRAESIEKLGSTLQELISERP
jgi:hypothetical protein